MAETVLIDLPEVLDEAKTSEDCVMLVGARPIVGVGVVSSPFK